MLLFAVLFPSAAMANAGFFWAALPASVALWWVAIIPFLIEWYAFGSWFRLPWARAFGAVFLANLLSAIAGAVIGFVTGYSLDVAILTPPTPWLEALPQAALAILAFAFFVLFSASVNTAIEAPVLRRASKFPSLTFRDFRFVFLINATTSALIVLIGAGWGAILESAGSDWNLPEEDVESVRAYLEDSYGPELDFYFSMSNTIWNEKLVTSEGIDPDRLANWTVQASALNFREVRIVVQHKNGSEVFKTDEYFLVEGRSGASRKLRKSDTLHWNRGTSDYQYLSFTTGAESGDPILLLFKNYASGSYSLSIGAIVEAPSTKLPW